MHRKRVITSIIGLIILVALVGLGNVLVFWGVVSAAIVLGLIEFYNIAEHRQWPVYRLPGLLLGWLLSLVPLISLSIDKINLTDFTITLILLALFLYGLLTKQPLSESLPALAVTLLGIGYVSWFFGHLVFLRGLPYGKQLIFYLLLLVWSGDTGAYYIGSLWGKHRLAPVVSPKKTFEGAGGGLAASVLASCVAKWTFLPVLGYADCLILGILLAVIAQLGDLCESMLKRGADVKDSGTLLPGHGGILDRMDGVMFAAPVLYYYATLFVVV